MRILLAITSTLVRVRLQRTLLHDPEIEVVGLAHEADRAVELARSLRPDLVLCDARLGRDLASSAELPRHSCRLVVLSASGQSTASGLPTGIAAILPLDMPAAELVVYLRTMVDTRVEPIVEAAPSPRERPVENPDVWPTTRRIAVAAHGSAQRPPGWQPTSSGPAPSAEPPDAGERRRGQSAEQARVRQAIAAQPDVPQRDPVTGLLTREAAARTARLIQEMAYPVSAVIVEIAFARGSVVPTDLTTHHALLRDIGAALKPAVRRDDPVCHVEGMTFAVVLPGVHGANATVVLPRIEQALLALRLEGHGYKVRIDASITIHSWEPGMNDVDLLHSAVRAARARHAPR